MTIRLRTGWFILAAFSILMIAGCKPGELSADVSTIQTTGVPRTSICHYTGSPIVPYVEVALSDEAVALHSAHARDLIPAPVEGCPETLEAAEIREGAAGSGAGASAFSAGQSGGTNATSVPQALPSADGTSTKPAPTPVPAQCTDDQLSIADIIRTDSRFSKLLAFMAKAGWLELLETGSMTIFAPTDSAFADVDTALIQEWTSDTSSLNALLLYHIADGAFTTEQLQQKLRLQTMSGEFVQLGVNNGQLMLNGDTYIVSEDIVTCSGIVLVVDDVLAPPIFSDMIQVTPTITSTVKATATKLPTVTNVPGQPTKASNSKPASPIPTSTSVPPTATSIPTSTPRPTSTAKPPATSTPKPPPTATDVPPPTAPPATDVPPTATDVPPTATPTDDAPPPTAPPTAEPTTPAPTDDPGTGSTGGDDGSSEDSGSSNSGSGDGGADSGDGGYGATSG